MQFQFRKRYRKVDWKLLSNVDVDKITRDLDYQALQANIMNVAFCDTNSQVSSFTSVHCFWTLLNAFGHEGKHTMKGLKSS